MLTLCTANSCIRGGRGENEKERERERGDEKREPEGQTDRANMVQVIERLVRALD